MFTPGDHSTILTHRGLTVRLSPPTYFYCYLLHFSEKYKHAGHYLGATGALEQRLYLHRHGNGARLMEVVSKAGIDFTLARLWRVESWEESRDLERTLKHRHESPRLCPICRGLPVDDLVFLRQGHYPFSNFDKPGRRRPMPGGLI
jgi:predicted GIY-YIG superfamily endonuclease